MQFLLGAAAGAAGALAVAEKYPDVVPPLGLAKPADIKLTYFDLAGLGDKIRFTFLMGGQPFTDDRVKFDQWAALKPTTPFGVLPVMEVEGQTFSQSAGLINYAGKVTGLLPRDPIKALKVDEALGLDDDLRGKIRPSVMVGYDKSLSERAKKAKILEMRKEVVATHIPTYFGHFEKMLEGKEYLAGDKPTIADAAFLSTVRWITGGVLDHVPATVVDPYPNIKAYKEKLEARPEIEAYLASTKK